MKNQALITTLAVLLAVSLSAIVALVVSSEVLDSQAVANGVPVQVTPAPITVTPIAVPPATPAAPAESPASGDQSADDGQPSAPETDGETATPVGSQDDTPPIGSQEETGDAPAGEGDDTPADEDEEEDDDTPADEDEDDDTPADEDEEDDDTPADEDEEDDTPAEEDEEDDTPADEDEEDDDTPVVPPLCNVGWTPVGDECIFIGCPPNYSQQGQECIPFGLVLPCLAGQVLNDDGECEFDFAIFNPGLIVQICENGQVFDIEVGDCVPICPEDHFPFNGLCLPMIDPDIVNPQDFFEN